MLICFKGRSQIARSGRITYNDFNTGRKLVWRPGSQDIHERRVEPGAQFAGGTSGPFDMIVKLFGFFKDQEGWEVTRGLGVYQGQKVGVWKASRSEEDDPTRIRTFTAYVDIKKKLPIAGTDVIMESDGSIHQQTIVEFTYPETGPADIYEAGAPKTAQITPSPE